MSTAAQVGRIWAVGKEPGLEGGYGGQRSPYREGARKGPCRETSAGPRAGEAVVPLPGGASPGVEARGCRTYRGRAKDGKRAEASAEDRVAPETAFYRKYTEGMLRRYMRMSLEMGRVPSMLGKELFRGKVTSYRMKSFEDVIIFVHDVEKCLSRLDAVSLQLIGRISLQEYTHGETAGLTGLSLRSVTRKYGDALDSLTVEFLRDDLLEQQTESRCQWNRSGGGRGSR